jgi:hypothetical protein
MSIQLKDNGTKPVDHISIANGIIYRPRRGHLLAYDFKKDEWSIVGDATLYRDSGRDPIEHVETVIVR